ncbi:putative beta-galactosidase-like [Sesbania bispinosa]|nr:putative beta-galactosidase-like [Sesbania bispinosa]
MGRVRVQLEEWRKEIGKIGVQGSATRAHTGCAKAHSLAGGIWSLFEARSSTLMCAQAHMPLQLGEFLSQVRSSTRGAPKRTCLSAFRGNFSALARSSTL